MDANNFLKSKKLIHTQYIINLDDEKIYLNELLSEYAELKIFTEIVIKQNDVFQKNNNRFKL